jgi:hypothetical protein
MIINSIIAGGFKRENISISTTQSFIVKDENEVIELSFSYNNIKSLKGLVLLYIDGEVVPSISFEIEDGVTDTIDITDLLDETALYRVRLIVVDSDGSADSLEYRILYNYQNLDELSFIYNASLNGYVLSKYNGNDPEVLIPEQFSGTQGVLSVVGIGDGAFFDNDTLIKVVMPNTIQFIGVTAFFSCTLLKEVVIPIEVPPLLNGDNVFDPYLELSFLEIFVPSASVQAYKDAEYWDEYANAIVPIVSI